jgi:hypothetical protein
MRTRTRAEWAAILDPAETGGFNWSLQRSMTEGCDGQTGWVDAGVDGQGADEVAGEAVAAA